MSSYMAYAAIGINSATHSSSVSFGSTIPAESTPSECGGFHVAIVIELDDGNILTGKPDQFDGKNHGFL